MCSFQSESHGCESAQEIFDRTQTQDKISMKFQTKRACMQAITTMTFINFFCGHYRGKRQNLSSLYIYIWSSLTHIFIYHTYIHNSTYISHYYHHLSPSMSDQSQTLIRNSSYTYLSI